MWHERRYGALADRPSGDGQGTGAGQHRRPARAARCACACTPGSTRSPRSATTSSRSFRPVRGPGARPRTFARRLVQQVAERRNPRTSATVDQLLSRYLDQFDGTPNTLELYRTHVRNHISPVLGHLKVGRLDPETLDSFYAELRRCRRALHRAAGGRSTTARPATTSATERCGRTCAGRSRRPRSATSTSSCPAPTSGRSAGGWVGESPTTQAEPPRGAEAEPAAADGRAGRADRRRSRGAIPTGAALVWMAMTTGDPPRRAVRDPAVVARSRSRPRDDLAAQGDPPRARGPLGRGRPQDPPAASDRARRRDRRRAARAHRALPRPAAKLGIELVDDAFVFSDAVDGSDFLTPDSVTQRYDRMATRSGSRRPCTSCATTRRPS